MLQLALLCLPLLQGSSEPVQDILITSKGREYQGVVLIQTDESVLFSIGSKSKVFPREKIRSLAGPRLSYERYIAMLEWAYASTAEAADAIKLAQWCASHGLARDVRLHYWQALVKDPENAVAHQALGHRQRGGSWQAPSGNGVWLSVEELDAWHSDPHQPWIFTSAHFNAEVNGRLEEAVRAVAHAELLYARFFDALQSVAGFYELLEPITLRIYASRDSGYPEISPGTHGYFDSQSEIVTTWMEDGRAKNLVRITCHALQLRCATERARACPEDYPGWLNEGIATYFVSSFLDLDNDGLAEFHDARLNLDWLRLQYQANPPLQLGEVLNLPITGFQDQKKAALAHAQAYSLLYFLLATQDSELQAGFNTYLHSVFAGKGGTSAFKKSFARKAYKGLEKKWTDFVEKSVLRDQK